jgi:regulator of protease activity HflC (stomatin/prohibitin superfamily)
MKMIIWRLAMSQNTQTDEDTSRPVINNRIVSGCLAKLAKNATLILVLLIVGFGLFSLARSAVYKIRPYERGLHLRGGRFIGIDQPGWHIKIPYVDTVIGVTTIERSGMVENLAAMTADDVTMDISLLYTYRVVDPVRYQLEVLDPDRIVAGFVQGTLRDLVNTQKMDDVLHLRADFNQELFTQLQEKEDRYGIEFILVQVQNASPPAEVVNAIKDKMVAVQLQEKAIADADQLRTLADSEFYAAQKKAEGDAYQITAIAEADAQRIVLSSQAQIEAMREILQELEGKGSLAEQYIQVLIAQELRENSKLIISNGETMPVIDLRETTTEVQSTEAQPTEVP